MSRSSLVAVLAVLLFAPVRVSAADGPSPTPLADAAARAAREAAAAPLWTVDRPQHRPTALSALYGTYAALQVMDLLSTRRAVAGGAAEANPLMNRGNTATMIAVKAAASAGTIYFTERAWKKNRAGAVVLMAALNGATAAIVARNARNARR